MYFYKKKGNQYLDLDGNFILSHNNKIIKASVKSAAPVEIENVMYSVDIKNLKFHHKCKLVMSVIRFIFGKVNVTRS